MSKFKESSAHLKHSWVSEKVKALEVEFGKTAQSSRAGLNLAGPKGIEQTLSRPAGHPSRYPRLARASRLPSWPVSLASGELGVSLQSSQVSNKPPSTLTKLETTGSWEPLPEPPREGEAPRAGLDGTHLTHLVILSEN